MPILESLDRSGTNTDYLVRLLGAPATEQLEEAFGQAFCFAHYSNATARNLLPGHKIEIWDEAVQYSLRASSKQLLANSVDRLCLEKYDAREVWKYGISIVETKSKNRNWTLPDGILSIGGKTIAIELDHGTTLGNWSTQLVKALRVLAGENIDGILFTYFFEGSSSPFTPTKVSFSNEFKSIVKALTFNKPVSILTSSVDSCNSKGFKESLIELLASRYLDTSRKAATSSQVAADLLLKKLLEGKRA